MIGWKVLRVCPDIGDTIVTNISGLFKNEFFLCENYTKNE